MFGVPFVPVESQLGSFFSDTRGRLDSHVSLFDVLSSNLA